MTGYRSSPGAGELILNHFRENSQQVIFENPIGKCDHSLVRSEM